MKIISKETGQRTESSKPEQSKQSRAEATVTPPKKVTSKREDGLSSDAKRVVVKKTVEKPIAKQIGRAHV